MDEVCREEAIDLAVIGGGPAGLMCALTAAERSGKAGRIAVLEKMPRPGNKLLATGSGRCNLTHSGEMADFLLHYGRHGRFLKPALFGFTNIDLLEFFKAMGLDFVTEDGGKVFPSSGRAGDVLDVLRAAADRLKVEIRTDNRVRGIVRRGESYEIAVDSDAGCVMFIRARAICVATGGASYPGTGSTGDGYALAAALGHAIVDPAPCLAPVTIHPWNFGDCSGHALRNRKIVVSREGTRVAQGGGDILFTHSGLSGPGILDLSRDIRAGDSIAFSVLEEGCDPEPALLREIDAHGKREIRTILHDLGLPENLSRAMAVQAGIDPATRSCDLSRNSRKALGFCLSACVLRVSALGDFSRAMATRGGVDLESVNAKTMESRLCPDLYFAGEVLDIDGDTGGYNLQAAFSTGRLAGYSAAGPR